MEIKLKREDIDSLLNIKGPKFEKYVSNIINSANNNAQGTRPKVVGQMSDLIQEFPGSSLSDWE